MGKIIYGKSIFKQLNSDTYLKTRDYIWTGDGSRGIEEFLFKDNDKNTINLGRYKNSLRIYSEKVMIIYNIDNDFLEIEAVIDLNKLKELTLTKSEKLKYFKEVCEAQVPPKEDLDVEVLNDTNDIGKKRVFYKNY